MGGRGSSSKMGGGIGSGSGGGGGGKAKTKEKPKVSASKSKTSEIPVRKFTSKELNGMKRKDLETIARAVFINNAIKRGMSASEADYRARSLMSGNSNTNLKKYILKHNK